MEKISLIVISLATFLNAISVIITFIAKAKKPIDKIVDNRFKEALEPLNSKLSTIEQRTDKIDENQCRNFLVDFLADVEVGIEKDEIQIKRAYEVYEHYTNDLHKNSYIHDKWERLMK
ncbi:MAG: hypothetical protein HFJ48_00105 [Clostridia bacterium]|nr:hypothetical protein [Clostridia bacterium]